MLRWSGGRSSLTVSNHSLYTTHTSMTSHELKTHLEGESFGTSCLRMGQTILKRDVPNMDKPSGNDEVEFGPESEVDILYPPCH